MSELGEQLWAVISERGCEAAGLAHADAAGLVRRLAGERISGLCVVTSEAAARLQRTAQLSANGKSPAKKTTRRKRAAQK
jgi:hypothetical protein